MRRLNTLIRMILTQHMFCFPIRIRFPAQFLSNSVDLIALF
jgi:hypothetical protein